MPSITIANIVGALLEGLTVARVRSDVFSGGASQQYLTNPDLQSYPVPRVEIRSADVDMKFTILETEEREVDVFDITRAVLFDGLPFFIDDALAIPGKPAPDAPATARRPLRVHAGEAAEAVRLGLLMAMEGFVTQDIWDMHAQLIANPYRFARDMVEFKLHECLPPVLSSNGVTMWLDDPEFVRLLADAAERWSLRMHEAVQLAIEMAQANGFEMELGVKRDQFQYVPEHALSSLKLNMVVENYEWTLSQDKQGNTTRKLTRQ
jgi:hypothetical protein